MERSGTQLPWKHRAAGSVPLAMAAIVACLLSGCGSSGGGSTSTGGATGVAPPPGAGSGSGDSAASGEGCYIHLYDGNDFKDTDFKLTKPGSYRDLANLPGASQDWTDEADSAKVGPAATVTIYEDTGFTGQSMTLKPGSDHASLDPEPSSLKLRC